MNAAGPVRRRMFFCGNPISGGAGSSGSGGGSRTLPAQMDADEKFLFRICVNRRVLRASPDSVAAGRVVLSVAK